MTVFTSLGSLARFTRGGATVASLWDSISVTPGARPATQPNHHMTRSLSRAVMAEATVSSVCERHIRIPTRQLATGATGLWDSAHVAPAVQFNISRFLSSVSMTETTGPKGNERHRGAVTLQFTTSSFDLDPTWALEVTKIHVSDTIIDAAWAQLLEKALIESPLLCELTFERCVIPDSTILVLEDALHKNRGLDRLALTGNMVGEWGITALSNAFQERSAYANASPDTSGPEMHFCGNREEPDRLNDMCCTYNPRLNGHLSQRWIKLSGFLIGEEGGLFIARSLRDNPTLESLTLENCTIPDNSIKIIADALQENTVTHTLVLSNLRISADGARMLGNALKNREVPLETLHVNNNSCGVYADDLINKGHAERVAEFWKPQ